MNEFEESYRSRRKSRPAHIDDQDIEQVARPKRSDLAARFSSRLSRIENVVLSKWWVLVLGICCGLGVEWYMLSKTPPSYVSSGRMIVSMMKLSLPNATAYQEELNNFYGTQVALMQSSAVTNNAALRVQTNTPQLHPSPVKLEVTVTPKTSIFNLKATSGDKEYTTDYLDAVMAEFVNLKKGMRQQASDTTKVMIQDELLRMSLELKAGKERLVNYQSSNSVVFLQDQGNSAGNYLGFLTRQSSDLKSELQLLGMLTLDQNLERQQSIAQQTLSQQPASAINQGQGKNGEVASPAEDQRQNGRNSAALVGSEAEYMKAKQQIQLLKADRTELGKVLRPKHPKILALNEDIARKESLLEIFRGQSQDQLENRKHALELQIQNLDADIKVWEGKSLEISKKMADYLEIKESLHRLQGMYDGLLTTSRTLEVDKEVSPESVNILEPALPAVMVPQKAMQNLALAGSIGLAISLALLLWLDRMDDRPTSFSELESMFDETVVGQIPLDKTKVGKNGKDCPILQPEDERHALTEAYRSLRSSLIFMKSPREHPRCIAITSAIPNDGKSMTSSNLAITIARGGAKVLLVDADLRRGALHRRFGFESGSKLGLSDVLAGKCLWTVALLHTDVPNLDLLPRGAIPPHPGELFLGKSAAEFLKSVAANYEFVLFDTPPVMAADDVSNLAPHLDGLLLVVRAGFTSARIAHAALDLLYLRRVSVLGVVFNAVEARSREYYYYYKYSDYYTKTPAA